MGSSQPGFKNNNPIDEYAAIQWMISVSDLILLVIKTNISSENDPETAPSVSHS